MATKKTDEAVSVLNTNGSDWDEKVKIRLPKGEFGDANYQIASVNGKVFKIQKGVEVEVPKPIAEVLNNSMNAKQDAEEFMEGKAN